MPISISPVRNYNYNNTAPKSQSFTGSETPKVKGFKVPTSLRSLFAAACVAMPGGAKAATNAQDIATLSISNAPIQLAASNINTNKPEFVYFKVNLDDQTVTAKMKSPITGTFDFQQKAILNGTNGWGNIGVFTIPKTNIVITGTADMLDASPSGFFRLLRRTIGTASLSLQSLATNLAEDATNTFVKVVKTIK